MLLFAFMIQPINSDSDREFMDALFRKHYPKMKTAALHYCRAGQSYEDIIQHACIGLVGNVKKLRSLSANEDAVAAYFWITIRHSAIDCFEKEQRHQKNRVSWEYAEPLLSGDDLEKNVEQKVIHSVLAKLSERDRILLYCQYCFGLDYRQTAKLANVKTNLIWSYLQDARKRAMKLIMDEKSKEKP